MRYSLFISLRSDGIVVKSDKPHVLTEYIALISAPVLRQAFEQASLPSVPLLARFFEA